MILKNDRKKSWGNSWKEFDLDNSTIRLLRKVARKDNTHFLKLIAELLKQLYTTPANNLRIVLIFKHCYTVFDGINHKTTHYENEYLSAKDTFPKPVATCTLSKFSS